MTARQRALSAGRIAKINGARLTDPEGVRIIRDAAKDQRTWKVVHPEVLDALAVPELQVQSFGGTLDDLLGEIEAYGLPAVETSLDLHRRARHEYQIGESAVQAKRPAIERAVIKKRRPAIEAAGVQKQRPQIEAEAVHAWKQSNAQRARAQRTIDADARAREWIAEIDLRPSDWFKKEAEQDIAARKEITIAAVRQAIAAYRRRRRQKKKTL